MQSRPGVLYEESKDDQARTASGTSGVGDKERAERTRPPDGCLYLLPLRLRLFREAFPIGDGGVLARDRARLRVDPLP
jgi:hypothetical protein